MELCNLVTLQLSNFATLQICNFATLQNDTWPLSRRLRKLQRHWGNAGLNCIICRANVASTSGQSAPNDETHEEEFLEALRPVQSAEPRADLSHKVTHDCHLLLAHHLFRLLQRFNRSVRGMVRDYDRVRPCLVRRFAWPCLTATLPPWKSSPKSCWVSSRNTIHRKLSRSSTTSSTLLMRGKTSPKLSGSYDLRSSFGITWPRPGTA